MCCQQSHERVRVANAIPLLSVPTECQFLADHRTTANKNDNSQAFWDCRTHQFRCVRIGVSEETSKKTLEEDLTGRFILLSHILRSVVWNVSEVIRTLTYILDHEVALNLETIRQKR